MVCATLGLLLVNCARCLRAAQGLSLPGSRTPSTSVTRYVQIEIPGLPSIRRTV